MECGDVTPHYRDKLGKIKVPVSLRAGECLVLKARGSSNCELRTLDTCQRTSDEPDKTETDTSNFIIYYIF